jgi:uncharacterized protein (DUF362 family)
MKKANIPVFITSGPNRAENIRVVLNAIESTVVLRMKKAIKVVIKPNFLSTRRLAASTHPQTLRAVLDWIRQHYNGPLIIAEGSKAYMSYIKNYRIEAMAQEYDASILNIDTDENKWLHFDGIDHDNNRQTIRYSQTAAKSFLISLSLPKMHGNAGVTLGIKNLMGLIHPKDRKLMHGFSRNLNLKTRQLLASPKWEKDTIIGEILSNLTGLYVNLMGIKAYSSQKQLALANNYSIIGYNIAQMSKAIRPNLTVLDAYYAMEGVGPWFGHLVKLNTALASPDAQSIDLVTANMIGLESRQISYLHHILMANPNINKNIVFPLENPRSYTLKPHPNAIFQQVNREKSNK